MRVCIVSVMRGLARDEANGADLGNLLTHMRLDSNREHFRGEIAIGAVASAAYHGDAVLGIELHELDVHGLDSEQRTHSSDRATNAIIHVRRRALLEECHAGKLAVHRGSRNARAAVITPSRTSASEPAMSAPDALA